MLLDFVIWIWRPLSLWVVKIYDKVYADIREDKELYNYKKKGATELLKLQADGFVEKQKKSM